MHTLHDNNLSDIKEKQAQTLCIAVWELSTKQKPYTTILKARVVNTEYKSQSSILRLKWKMQD